MRRREERVLSSEEGQEELVVKRVALETWDPCSYQRKQKGRLMVGFIRHGEIHTFTEGKVYRLGPGALMAHMPNCDVEVEVKVKSELLVGVGVGEAAFALAARLFGPTALGIPGNHGLRLGAMLQWIFDIALQGGAHRELRCARLFGTLLYEISALSSTTHPEHGGAFSRWIRCKDHIDAHYREITSVAHWAEACHLDRSHLSRLARRFSSSTAQAYLLELRLSDAAERLSNGQESIATIAEEGGWSDPFVFSKAFRRKFGQSPRVWRTGGY